MKKIWPWSLVCPLLAFMKPNDWNWCCKSAINIRATPVAIYLFKFNTKAMCEICSTFNNKGITTKTPEWHPLRRRSSFFIVKIWPDFTYCSGVPIVDYEHVHLSWVINWIFSKFTINYQATSIIIFWYLQW